MNDFIIVKLKNGNTVIAKRLASSDTDYQEIGRSDSHAEDIREAMQGALDERVRKLDFT